MYEQGLIVAKKKNINPLQILIHLAGAYNSLGKKDKATQTIHKILEIDPSNIEAHSILS